MIDCSLKKRLHTADGEMQLNIQLHVESGQFVGLYGNSGAGKTSVLRMLAGLLKPEEGFIKAGDKLWFDAARKISIEPQLRNIGFVFQDYALFPNMNVKENIAFALSKADSTFIVDELLDLTGLTTLAYRKIETLSGGQKQRVSVARAIAKKPLLLLLDEPLSAIDNEMRLHLQEMLFDVHKKFALTTILVSHDMSEIMRLCDFVIHLQNGAGIHYASPSLFFDKSGGNGCLDGKIISIERSNYEAKANVLIDSRLLKINIPVARENYIKGSDVKIIVKDGIFQILES